MIGMRVEMLPEAVDKAKLMTRKFGKRVIYRMAGYQQAIERTSMKDAPHGKASPPGTPPHTHSRVSKKGNRMKAFPDFIRFKVEGTDTEPSAVVGPTAPSKGKRSNWAEKIGKTHEFGGTATVEKRVTYRPVKAGEKGIKLPGQEGTWRSRSVVLFRQNGRQTFPFTIQEKKQQKNKNVVFLISYRANYPKRPFAAPALKKTVAATRAGKFG
jgi:hypothetical protein